MAAFVLRLLVRAAMPDEDYWAHGYWLYADAARHLAAGQGYALSGAGATAYRVPLYALFVAAVSGGTHVWALLVAQAVVSAGTAALGGLIARRLYSPASGLVAAAWYAVYPYAVWHDLALQESGLFAMLTALGTFMMLVLRERRGVVPALATGAVLGLALLTRAMLLPFVFLSLVWLLLPDGGRHSLSRRALTAGLAAAAIALALTPWLVRSHQMTGAYSLGTESGATLYAGASPLLFSRFPQDTVDASRAEIFAAIPEQAVADRERYSRGNAARESDWYTRQARSMIAADPLGYAERALRKLAIAFGPLPAPRHGLLGQVGYAVWWVPLLMLGLAGAWRDRAQWRRNLAFAAHFAAFAGVTALAWAQTSHRAYLDVYLMVLAAPVVVGLLPPRLCARLGS